MKTTEILALYLKANGINTTLGETFTTEDLSPSDQKLIAALSKKSSENRVFIIVMFSSLLLILLVSFYFIFYYRDSPTTIITLSGGTVFSTFGVVARMHRLWIDKSKTDFLVITFPFLDRKERISIIKAYARIDDSSIFNFNIEQRSGIKKNIPKAKQKTET